jgi:uncharacterized protein YraI
MSISSGLSGRGLLIFTILMPLCLALVQTVRPTAAGAQGNTAVVTGAEHVFIRRGPGTEFPPFANLSEGTKVEIQEMRGEWARVLTASGQSGYVRSNFLALPAEQHASPGAVTSPTPRSRATSPTVGPTQRAVTPQRAPDHASSPTPENRHVQEEPTPSKSETEQVPTPLPSAGPSASELEKLRADLVRLNAAAEQLQRRLDVDAPKDGAIPLAVSPVEGGSMFISTGILLGAIGLCIGWLLGNAYGRRRERGRRPRVRL